ncbi:MAG: sigma-70 family RNA polymerase sigma factor [Microthrixaceae bacterium]
MDQLTRLAVAAGDGNRRALADFISASQADVWRLCAHLVDRDSADDLTQEVYVRAVPALARFRGDSSARTWLLTIARRTCADWLRRLVRTRRLHERLASVAAVDPVVSDPARVFSGDLDALVDRLPQDRRSAFVLTQIIGLSYAEASEVCGVAVGTIRSRVSRARSELLEGLGEASRRSYSLGD